MAEFLEIFDLKGKFLEIQERKKFHKEIETEFKKKGKISRKVKSIRILLMNSKGRVYLQKRSKLKDQNSGLYDKTIGGHTLKNESFELTVTRECAEELGFPAIVVSEKEFSKAIKTIHLETIGILKKADYFSTFQSVRIFKKGNQIVQPSITTIYIGYYDGAIKFVDGESSGIETFSLKELEKEIKENPNKFTEDLKFMVKKYKKHIKPIS